MSITFSTDRPARRTGFSVTCYGYGAEHAWMGPVHPTAEAATAEHDQSHRGDADCDAVGAVSSVYARYDTDADPSVNMSNTNALHLLQTLGFDGPVYCGSCPAEDFLGRVLVALAITPHDAGIPAHVIPGDGPVVVDGGRREGYTQERLEQLRTLAEFARRHSAQITWA